MRLPTEQEQQALRDSNRRVADGVARLAPVMTAMIEAWKEFARQMGAVAAATIAGNIKARLEAADRLKQQIRNRMGVPPRDVYLEVVERTWGDMQRQHFPNYVFREGVEPVAYQLFVGEDSEIIHEACAKTPEDREFPLYEDDIQAYRNVEPIQCFMCYGEIAAAKAGAL